MAYAAVASLLQTLEILRIHHQRSISPYFRNQIISIGKHTSFLQWFIEGSSDRVNNWEERIREATNKAEDIIELLISDSLLKSTVESSRSEFEKGKYDVCYSLDELGEVRKAIESIAIRVKGQRRIATANSSDGEELMDIISRLGGGSSSLEIIAICGSGGMGKTTLASNAYFHPLIMLHFDVRMWSGVTREHNQVRMIREIMHSMKVNYSNKDSEDELIEKLLHNLGRRRFLICLDDVWSKDVLEWLNTILPDYGNGSRIIFTTRSSDLAYSISAHHIHEMRLLDEDKTWNLLRKKIFKGDPCPFQLESVGKMIAKSCGGHPLSIAVVSGILLASDQTKAAWEDISDNMKVFSSEKDGDKVDKILSLSYSYLPHYLRPCLLYLRIFPQGRRVRVSRLVQMWAADGFVSECESKSLEEKGEEYVEELLMRSLVSLQTSTSIGKIKYIGFHDLVLGMCRTQAHIDHFNLHLLDRDYTHRPELHVKEFIKSCRRISSFNRCDFLSGVYGSTIRTLVVNLELGKLDLRCWIGNVRLLRILDLSYVNNEYQLSVEVFELFHLRYLAFRHMYNIPQSISNLENLQTLIILHKKMGGVFDKFPEGIWRMLQLRHLRIYSFKFPNRKGSTSAAALQNLQTLCRIVDFICLIENLKMIPNLKKLDLLYSEKSKDVVEDYELHNLSCLQKLEVLKIETSLSFKEARKMSYVFPPTLKKLSLRGLQLSWEDMKIVASLPNLEVLKLRNHACVGETWETSEGGFSQLLVLLIEESNLENWITKTSHFPRLWRLVLVRCSILLAVPYEISVIPTLMLIDLDHTNHSLLSSANFIRQNRHRLGHDPLDVSLV